MLSVGGQAEGLQGHRPQKRPAVFRTKDNVDEPAPSFQFHFRQTYGEFPGRAIGQTEPHGFHSLYSQFIQKRRWHLAVRRPSINQAPEGARLRSAPTMKGEFHAESSHFSSNGSSRQYYPTKVLLLLIH
jgi:hypothetical protein